MIAGIDAGWPHLLAALRFTRPWFDELQRNPAFDRIECTVDVGFGAGLRWARLLGFVEEARMSRFGLDGADHFLFARIARPRAGAAGEIIEREGEAA
jgi:hypothetical protein